MRLIPAGFVLLLALCLCGAGPVPEKPSPKDKCPVCGMFVAKYPDWVARVAYQDGAVAWFDGVKDLMKYYFRLDRYSPGRKVSDMATIRVTDYYSLSPIDGRTAWYVAGSDVYGPMGKELIPFANKAEAEEFLRDHRGVRILTFPEITPELLKSLD